MMNSSEIKTLAAMWNMLWTACQFSTSMQKRIILLSKLKTEATNLLFVYIVMQDWQDTAQDLLDQVG